MAPTPPLGRSLSCAVPGSGLMWNRWQNRGFSSRILNPAEVASPRLLSTFCHLAQASMRPCCDAEQFPTPTLGILIVFSQPEGEASRHVTPACVSSVSLARSLDRIGHHTRTCKDDGLSGHHQPSGRLRRVGAGKLDADIFGPSTTRGEGRFSAKAALPEPKSSLPRRLPVLGGRSDCSGWYARADTTKIASIRDGVKMGPIDRSTCGATTP
ncbi:hypothetical protein QBC39DRAFT_356477 [Podospora conica]|nr:hypothetical protein QBC39DRAFT_356477 [Schizothecium conicum]